MGKKSKEGGAVEDLLNLEKQIKEEKNSSKRDKMEAKLDLARKMASRKKMPTHQTLQDIQIQERFDKNPISRKTDIIGDDNLTGDYQKGGLIRQGKPKLAKKGWK
jgi:hypothetical protein